MAESHFEKTDDEGDAYDFFFDETFLVKAKLIKLGIWGPFTQVGKLTMEGIEFLEKHIEPLQLEIWEEYLEKQKKVK